MSVEPISILTAIVGVGVVLAEAAMFACLSFARLQGVEADRGRP